MSRSRALSYQLLHESEPTVGQMSFDELNQLSQNQLGLVLLGAGEPHQEWVDGVAGLLRQEGIAAAEPVFQQAAILTGNMAGGQGRTDLVLIFNPAAKLQIGKLAMWRLKFGDASWLDDFVVNYGRDYGAAEATDDPGAAEWDRNPDQWDPSQR